MKQYRGLFYWDKEQQKMVEHKPQPREKGQSAYFIPDEMEPTKHMANGKIYTSKSKFRAATKALGYEEVGNDVNYRVKKPERNVGNLEEDISRAYYQVRDNEAPLSEFDKERCKIQNNTIRHYCYDNRERNPDGTPRR